MARCHAYACIVIEETRRTCLMGSDENRTRAEFHRVEISRRADEITRSHTGKLRDVDRDQTSRLIAIKLAASL